jgi:hypothetical protein
LPEHNVFLWSWRSSRYEQLRQGLVDHLKVSQNSFVSCSLVVWRHQRNSRVRRNMNLIVCSALNIIMNLFFACSKRSACSRSQGALHSG